MGAWLIRQVFGETGIPITVADTDSRALADVSRWNTASALTPVHVGYSPEEGIAGIGDAHRFDAVCLAVPIEQVEPVASALFPHLAPETFVFDIASIKVAPVANMLAAAESRLSVLGTHPLFGPQVASVAGETVVLCRTDETRAHHAAWLSHALSERGALLTSVDAVTHDEFMSFVQMLPHFVYLAVADTFRRAGFPLSRSFDFQTPPYRSLIAFMGRLMAVRSSAQADLYASIQHHAQRPEVRTLFLDACGELHQLLQAGDKTRTSRHIEDLSGHFPHAEVTYCQALSAAANAAATTLDARLLKYRDTKGLCGIRHTGTGRVMLGLVHEVDRTTVTFSEATSLRDGRYCLIYDDRSRRAANALGFSERVREPLVLNRKHVSLLRDDEVHAWKLENLLHHRRRVSVRLPTNLRPEGVADILVGFVGALLSCEIFDVYEPGPGQRRVGLECTILGDVPPDEVVEQVKTQIEALIEPGAGESTRSAG
jgi:prephenate dehydrogenase